MKRPFLLDTCAALWIVAEEMSQTVADALTESRHSGLLTYVSPITAWEIGILARKGRFKSRHAPQRWFEILMETPGAALAELTPAVLMESSFLPGLIHGDPFDRVIAATAREYDFIVVTRDRALLHYAQQGYLSVFKC
ncbi:MAG: type II toxin-antitoxin system VapC family toxin [Alphaproteobacteria bacterium]|nr:type II toxin-antitoxin system VapC family toxin [Alphaproteobacteria bacterium]